MRPGAHPFLELGAPVLEAPQRPELHVLDVPPVGFADRLAEERRLLDELLRLVQVATHRRTVIWRVRAT